MKKLIPLLFLLTLSYSCQQEETLSLTLGKANFSLLQKPRGNGLVSEKATPAFVLLSFKDSKGIAKEYIKLPLFVFGQSYISENLELQTGTYQLVQFAVLDAANKVIYATPLKRSDLGNHVTHPLPIDFTIEQNQNTQVIPEVLAVSSEDNPEDFGLTSFEPEIPTQIGKVKKVVLTDFFIEDAPVVTTMNVEYDERKVRIIHWNIDYEAGDIHHDYMEERFYLPDGNLDSISSGRIKDGTWNLSFRYKNGLRHKIISNRNGNDATVTFTDYRGAKPGHIENLYGMYGAYGSTVYPHSTTLEFDLAGNLISQKNTEIPGFGDKVEEKTTVYGTELNPLRNLFETPIPQAFEFFDDLAFYFSSYLPSSADANYPYADPRHNRTFFEYGKDDRGRVTQVRAFKPDTTPRPRPRPVPDLAPRYTLDITYY